MYQNDHSACAVPPSAADSLGSSMENSFPSGCLFEGTDGEKHQKEESALSRSMVSPSVYGFSNAGESNPEQGGKIDHPRAGVPDSQTEIETMRRVVQQSSLRHIAFIMDGNGRYAQKRSLPREAGHVEGAKNFKVISRYCRALGIEYCTVYAFSTENWKRPRVEVDAIMRLLDRYLREAEDEIDVAFRFIGDKNGLAPSLAKRTAALEDATKDRAYHLNIALNYGGRAEIVHAVNALFAEGKQTVTEEEIQSRLYTAGCPDPDLIVRTGNEMRFSNFLLWQSAYSELYFSDKLWPEFTKRDVDAAIRDFSGRRRRFGGLDKTKSKEGE